MQYGNFDDAQREYVITNPKTPVKWINYIGALDFGGFVDHTGGALLCKGDPALNRITKYIPQLAASDFRGETLYARCRLPGSPWRILTPFFTPSLQPYERFECHVGLGYSRWITEYAVGETGRLRFTITVFVPSGAQVEVRDIQVTNLGPQSLEVELFPLVEYTHFDSLKQFTNADWVPQTMQSRALPWGERTVLVQYAFMRRETQLNFFTANRPAASFETDRARFLGDHEYAGWAHPLSLDLPQLGNYEAQRGDNIAVLQLPLGLLAPGQTERTITLLGQEQTSLAALQARLAAPGADWPAAARYLDPAEVDAALAQLAAFWQDYLGKFQVQTPDPAFDSMINVHNPRQCFITKNWSRYLSLYQLGLGNARGIGVRDSSQDVLAVLPTLPQQAKELICRLLSVQRPDGSAYHQFNPLTMEASEGDSLEREDRLHYYSDDHLWGVLAVCEYLKETGDLNFLQQQIAFYSPAPGKAEGGSVFEHLQRALAFTKNDTGAHGLPRLGFADWNDTINLPTGAESLFTANLYGKALKEMIALCRHLASPASLIAQYEQDYAEMAARVNEQAWDGEWYVRYFDHDGTPLGSKQNVQGQIYVNSQSWAVISGFAGPERARLALDSLRARLNTAKGIKLSAPGFNGFDPAKGGVTTYPPGAKENGGIFLHTNPWVIIAEALLGRGERAYEYYNQINPAAKNDRIDEFEAEPYVYPQNILGDEHPQFGLGRNSWLSGTASWTYQAATQYLLGIRAEHNGLRVQPCLPPHWDGFKASRLFRGVQVQITVKRDARKSGLMLVDGKPIPGNLAPLPSAGTTAVQIELFL